MDNSSLADIFGSFVACFVGTATIFSTFYDYYTSSQQSPSKKIWKAFSITSNFNQLMKINNSPKVIHCIDGIKAISILMILVGHRISYIRPYWFNWMSWQQIVMRFLNSYPFCVVSFFTCSGILVSQSTLRSLNKGNLNIISNIIKRYFRLIPVFAVLLLYVQTSAAPDDVGAKFNTMKNECKAVWKENLMLYFYFDGPYCIGNAWYLGVDIQLFIIAPLFIYILYKFQLKGVVAVASVIILLQVYRYLEMINSPYRNKWWFNYLESYFRLGEYLIGVITGYLMYNEEFSTQTKSKMNQNRFLVYIGWILSLGFLWFHIYGLRHTVRFMSPFQRLIYKTVERDCFAMSICWIVFACQVLESGVIINNFLSHPAWQPISKLTLNMLLIQMIYMFYTFDYYKQPQGFLWLSSLLIGDIVITIVLSASAYILIEAPFGQIVDYVGSFNCWNLKPTETKYELLSKQEGDKLLDKA